MNNTIKKIILVLLRWVSQAILWRHKPVVIAITGSVGKTTTKDIVAHGMKSVVETGKAEKSFNSDFGVPLSIIGVENPWGSVIGWLDVILKGIKVFSGTRYPKVLVLEVGTRFPGDVPRLAKWIKPHVSMITHIPDVPVHIEFFGTREAIVDEKSALAKYMRKDGTLILNRDSEHVFNISKNSTHKITTIGFHQDSNIRAVNMERVINESGQYGMKFDVQLHDRLLSVFAPGFIAKHQVYGVLFAVAAADSLGYDTYTVAESMSNLVPTVGRLNPLIGVNDTLILDDSYNASPAAMEAAIETLVSIDTPGRHFAVLGDMLDLGKMTKDVHENVGAFLKDQKLDYLFLVGPRMAYAYEMLVNAKYPKTKIQHSDNPMDALPIIQKMMKKGDVVLIKGSQGMRMEKIVAELIEDKENSHKLLVRQDEEWKKR